jgi:uncharacterized protein YsxB (DUF464 family)
MSSTPQTRQAILDQIAVYARKLEDECPQVYQNLAEENPLTLPSNQDEQVTLADLQAYLETLKTEYEKYIETHGS